MQMEDRSWMYESGDVLAHFKEVSIFLEAVAQHATREKEEAIYCPYKVCNNNVMYMYKDCEIIHEHLVQSGFIDNYFIWSKHGETQPRTESIKDEREEANMNVDHVYSHHDNEGLDVEELMQNVTPDVFLQCRNKGFDNFKTLNKASRDLLYEECKGCNKEHTMLWMTLELLKLKDSNGWSDSSFSTLLELLSKVLPKPNILPTSTYLAKKIICLLTLGIEKIHACPNHILYQKEHEFKDKCSFVSTNGMTTLRKIPTIISGKDRRGRTLLLQIKTVKGLKREKFLPL
jgi:hypothetical protein